MITPVQEVIIQEWISKDTASFALHYKGDDLDFIVNQIKGRKKISSKFPFLKDHPQFIFPPSISVEQSSSQFTAYAKSLLIQGSRVLDMTGGMGIDAYFLAKKNEHVTVIEQNEQLVEINRKNIAYLKCSSMEVIHGDSIAYLRDSDKKFDVIYIDPARRSADGLNKKVFLLEDLRPNVLELIDLFFEKADDVWIKLSPLIDITYLCSTFKNIKEIIVIGVKNEVKEVLLHLQKDLDNGYSQERVALEIDANMTPRILSDDLYEPTRMDTYNPFGQYIYEPSKTIIKAQLGDKAAIKSGLNKLQANTHFYSSNTLYTNWEGRIFKLERILSARPKQFKKDFPYKKANIISRNHPMTPKTIKSKYGLVEGGERFILAFSDLAGRHLISANRIQ